MDVLYSMNFQKIERKRTEQSGSSSTSPFQKLVLPQIIVGLRAHKLSILERVSIHKSKNLCILEKKSNSEWIEKKCELGQPGGILQRSELAYEHYSQHESTARKFISSPQKIKQRHKNIIKRSKYLDLSEGRQVWTLSPWQESQKKINISENKIRKKGTKSKSDQFPVPAPESESRINVGDYLDEYLKEQFQTLS